MFVLISLFLFVCLSVTALLRKLKQQSRESVEDKRPKLLKALKEVCSPCLVSALFSNCAAPDILRSFHLSGDQIFLLLILPPSCSPFYLLFSLIGSLSHLFFFLTESKINLLCTCLLSPLLPSTNYCHHNKAVPARTHMHIISCSESKMYCLRLNEASQCLYCSLV